MLPFVDSRCSSKKRQHFCPSGSNAHLHENDMPSARKSALRESRRNACMELRHAKSQFGLATQMGVCACYTT